MRIALQGAPQGYNVTLQELLWLYFSDATLFELTPEEDQHFDGIIYVAFEQENDSLRVSVSLKAEGKTGCGAISQSPWKQDQNELRRLTKLALLRAMEDWAQNSKGYWGILTGVRPTKLVHRLLDEGCSLGQVQQTLEKDYALHRDKARLLLEVSANQRHLFPKKNEHDHLVSMYIGIPFCPSRCLYCSFPGYELKNKKDHLLEPFLDALYLEIKAVGRFLSQKEMLLQTLYIGGGTPTVLSARQLDNLMKLLLENVPMAQQLEFTLEAGRPDTLDAEKLKLMRACGVNRLSINPQTMNDRTLALIGRHHHAKDIEATVAMAREIGFPVINMDLILGLPGETAADVENTMNIIENLAPENLTVHTLAVKRASRLTAERENWVLPPAHEAAKMLEVTKGYVKSWGMVPYYLYRQKKILAQLENVGYCLPAKQCVYNIFIMEERQTILGLGCGSATKVIDSFGNLTSAWHNPKDPINYIQRIGEVIDRKQAIL